MAGDASIPDVRRDEYKEIIATWRHLQNVRYAIIGASITGFVGLIGAFQLAFPREVPSIEMGTATMYNPRLYIVGIIPIAGMIMGLAGVLGLIEWYWEQSKLLKFGRRLEKELGIVTPIQNKKQGFFTLGTSGNNAMFTGSFGFSFIVLLASTWAWHGVLGEVEAYKARLPRPVVIKPMPRVLSPVPMEKKEESK